MTIEYVGAAAPIACHWPKVDASDRSIAPFALIVLTAFGLFWAAMAGWIAADAWRVHNGTLVMAEVTEGNQLRYAERDGRVREISRMKGWDRDRAADGRVALRVIEGRAWAKPAGSTLTELCLAVALFLIGPGMLCAAWRHRGRLREDAERRERLRVGARRVRADAVRVIEKRAGGSRTRRTEYVALVRFTAPDGRPYEAASDRFPSGSAPVLSTTGLDVLFDARHPLDSLVDETSPAMRAARKSRPFAWR